MIQSMIQSHEISLWLFNIAMENGPFIDGLPIKNGDFPWFSMAMLNKQMVTSHGKIHHAINR